MLILSHCNHEVMCALIGWLRYADLGRWQTFAWGPDLGGRLLQGKALCAASLLYELLCLPTVSTPNWQNINAMLGRWNTNTHIIVFRLSSLLKQKKQPIKLTLSTDRLTKTYDQLEWYLDIYAAFRLACRLPHCRFDDDICTAAQAWLAAEGWPSGKQRLANQSITLPLCPPRQIAYSWLQFNLRAMPLDDKPKRCCRWEL